MKPPDRALRPPYEGMRIVTLSFIAVAGIAGIVTLAYSQIDVPPSLAALAGISLAYLGADRKPGRCPECDAALAKIREGL